MTGANFRIDYPHVSVRTLEPKDALHVQEVMAEAWDAAYVAPGLMTPAERAKYVNPNVLTALESY